MMRCLTASALMPKAAAACETVRRSRPVGVVSCVPPSRSWSLSPIRGGILPVEPETVEFVEEVGEVPVEEVEETTTEETTIEETVEAETIEEVPRSVTTGSGSAPVQTLWGRLRGFLGRR